MRYQFKTNIGSHTLTIFISDKDESTECLLRFKIFESIVINLYLCHIFRLNTLKLLFAAVLRIAANYCFHGSSLLTAVTETHV